MTTPDPWLTQRPFPTSGRVNHYQRVMAYHRSYLDMFYTSHSFVMKEPGPVPVVWRQYIGIMAASRNKSAYFCKLQEELFLRAGGDPEWLQSVEKCPKKLQNLNELNALLAHRPWLISAEHISVCFLFLAQPPSLLTLFCSCAEPRPRRRCMVDGGAVARHGDHEHVPRAVWLCVWVWYHA